MKYEIEIELPEHLRDKWRAVAYGEAQPGQWVLSLSLSNGKVYEASCRILNCLIVEPIDQRDEIKKWWPKTLGFDWITRDELGVWGWFGDKPYLLDGELQNRESEVTSFSVVFEIIGVKPPKLANTAYQVWGNPWREQQ